MNEESKINPQNVVQEVKPMAKAVKVIKKDETTKTLVDALNKFQRKN